MTERSCTRFVPGTITAGVSAGQRTGVVYMSRLEMKRTWGNADLPESGDTTSDLAEHSRPWLTGVGVGRARVVPDLYPTKITEGQTMPENTTTEDVLAEIRDQAFAAIPDGGGERYTPTRYPYTYSADFLRAHPQLIPAQIAEQASVPADHLMSRAEAAHAKTLWAESIGVDERALAQIFADCYLIEHGIPLGIANTERFGPTGGAVSR